jgi:hypothetical protein
MENNMASNKCPNCSKMYKNVSSLTKHMVKCVTNNTLQSCYKNEVLSQMSTSSSSSATENTSSLNNINTIQQTIVEPNHDTTDSQGNTYDISMTFLEGNRVQVDVKKQSADGEDDGEQVLKEILKPKVSETYQDEIDKLEDLIKMVKRFSIPNNDIDKDRMIDQLKNTIAVMMIQAKNLIKEMKQMSYRNCYYKNNIMLASYVLDKCRKDVPESDDEFDQMFKHPEPLA